MALIAVHPYPPTAAPTSRQFPTFPHKAEGDYGVRSNSRLKAQPREAGLKKPDVPQNEPVRLATLRSLNILDTPAEERFDRLTRMARRVFSVPIALVTLVDEKRQWFKSRAGISLSESPRETSFCGHAILGNDIFVIPDATRDERFADNPLVVGEPQIRFYAGCPLRSLDGHNLGTLCIIDRQARTLGADDLEALRDLAAIVEQELVGLLLATVDELTNLSNRRGFMLLAQYSLRLCLRQGIPMSLVFMDLDKFKQINDNFGHAEGDCALTVFADHLKRLCRDSDVIARLGGDEFVLLLPNATGVLAEQIIHRITQAIEKYNREATRGYRISFSAGIVEFDPGKHKTIGDLLAAGDLRMYAIKNAK